MTNHSSKGKKQASISSFFGGGNKGARSPKKVAESLSTPTTSAAEVELCADIMGRIVVENVNYTLGDNRFDGEGRWVEVETPELIFINCYVPNSGMGLVRLDYRINEWYVTNELGYLLLLNS